MPHWSDCGRSAWLPETTERLSHGEPTFFVRGKKVFVTYADHHHDNRLSFWCNAPPGAQQALVAADPHRFYVPPYVGGRGWIGVYLDGPRGDGFWQEVAELVEDAYRMVAPRALLARLEAERPEHSAEPLRKTEDAGFPTLRTVVRRSDGHTP